jgi:hypothetical protein
VATVKPAYAGSTSTISVTLASLANSTTLSTGYRQSAAVDNSTNLYLDALVTGKFTTASGAGATGYVGVFLYAWDGTQYTNNATGSDAAYTADATANLLPICPPIAANVASSSFYLPPTYVAAGAGLPFLPQKWGLIIQNVSGATFSSVAGSHLLEYQGVNATVA